MPEVTNGTESAQTMVQPSAYPLDDFYAQAGRPLPRIDVINGDDVPEPARTLLVHDSDMTPTLEKFHAEGVRIEVLSRKERGDMYFREVVLETVSGSKPVEFGAIKINLALFPAAAQKDILAELLPLGRILAKWSLKHSSHPKAYLKVESDDFIRGALKLSKAALLYGRRNTLSDPQGRPLAEIVEILPPHEN